MEHEWLSRKQQIGWAYARAARTEAPTERERDALLGYAKDMYDSDIHDKVQIMFDHADATNQVLDDITRFPIIVAKETTPDTEETVVFPGPLSPGLKGTGE